ncbi:MAG: glycoside hydrolase family 97 N-terminal domain-containing protein, partial [Syntrophothermus sp.]
MKNAIILFLLFVFIQAANAQIINSPGGKLSLSFSLSENGEPLYSLSIGKKTVLKPGHLGIKLEGQADFIKGFSVSAADTTSKDETWNPVWGEVKEIRSRYKELAVTLNQAGNDNRKIIIRFRLFDDGLGFRYEFPEQKGLQYFTVTDEVTEFNLTGDHKTFWIPGDYDSNEYDYSVTPLSRVNALRGNTSAEISVKTLVADICVQTPLMMKTTDGLYINIHEAALVNYPAMNLLVNKASFCLTSQLVPNAVGTKAYLQTPCHTPWRTVIVSDKAADILASKMILNLNEPSKISDVSWIKPMKYVGIWWGMHVGTMSWNYADVRNVKIGETDWTKLTPNGRHGATTENTKKYIDFAASHHMDGVLVEGWNI